MSNALRKIKRGVAKASMRKNGMSRFCKKEVTKKDDGARSFFAKHWRDYERI